MRKKNIYLISKEIFYVLSGALVIFAVLELIWPSLVLAYINLNWVLILWFIGGMVVLAGSRSS